LSPNFSLFLSPPTLALYTLSLHDALPICLAEIDAAAIHRRRELVRERFGLHRLVPVEQVFLAAPVRGFVGLEHGEKIFRDGPVRSEEHTSELQSRENLVCRLLLEKKKKII